MYFYYLLINYWLYVVCGGLFLIVYHLLLILNIMI